MTKLAAWVRKNDEYILPAMPTVMFTAMLSAAGVGDPTVTGFGHTLAIWALGGSVLGFASLAGLLYHAYGRQRNA